MDKSVKPGDDFYAYANGGWIEEHADPARPRRLRHLRDPRREGQQAHVEAHPGRGQVARPPPVPRSARSATTTPPSWTRPPSRRAALKPIQPELDQHRRHRRQAVARPRPRRPAARRRRRAQQHELLHRPTSSASGSSPDFDDPDRNAALPAAGRPRAARSRLLPAHRIREGRRAPQTKYRAHIAAVLKLADIADADEARRAHLRARAQDRRGARQPRRFGGRPQGEQSVDAGATSRRRRPGLDWTAFFDAAGLAAQPMFIVWQPSAVTGIAALVGSRAARGLEGLPDVPRDRSRVAVCCRRRSPTSASTSTARRSPARRSSARAGSAPSTPPTAPSATPSASSTSKHYFPPAAKAAAQAMVKNIVAAFGTPHRQARLDVAGHARHEGEGEARARSTSASAIPNTGATTPGSTIKRDDALGNVERSELFDYRAQPRQARQAGRQDGVVR